MATGFELIYSADCRDRAGPCLAGLAFAERLSSALELALHVTGAALDMTGQADLADCPACNGSCALSWHAEGGEIILRRGACELLRGHRAVQPVQ